MTRFCAKCRAEIPTERVEELPDTRLCVKCSEAVGGEFDLVFQDESLGKASSFKKNYGSFSVQKKRRNLDQ